MRGLQRLSLAGLALHLAALHAEPALFIDQAWVRAAPPGMTVTAAYMTLHNTGSLPTTIEAISSPQFDHASVHETRIENGVARMVALDGLILRPGERVVLEPGGLHVMLHGAGAALRSGDTVQLQLVFDDGSSRELTLPIRRQAP